jgi:hypothetical protein
MALWLTILMAPGLKNTVDSSNIKAEPAPAIADCFCPCKFTWKPWAKRSAGKKKIRLNKTLFIVAALFY